MAFKGQNSRAVAAKERKRSVAEEKRVLEEKAKEDLQWVDDSKIFAQKERRKREAEEKQQRKLERRQDKKQLEEEEVLRTQAGARRQAEGPTKRTRAQIAALQLQRQAKQTLRLKLQEQQHSATEHLLKDNINHAKREERYNDLLEGVTQLGGDSIDDVLHSLSLDSGFGDVGSPAKKKVSTIYHEFCAAQFAALRAEFPKLKRSQLLERVQKLWKTSPANPYSQKN